ncbi:hypothetical protein [Pukyongiella litopenaei]|uniref:Lipoprotein n=1 Tax=Pukyongiella litopenaei TaxID=2605946 RepID=A0A2S0MRF4_9RHOB|nr:hypothetical protein [Pukyongiella litopenaei]AVO38426.1 hypothetical protein C6Y53_12505 [Pukyongiella litopenaei]
MIRTIFLLAGLALLTACAPSGNTISGTPVPLGDFRLGHNVVVASKMQQGPISRDATEQEWVDALTRAVDARFGRYEGDQLYHFGVSVEGYMLAPPGIPVLYNPRSALIINVTVWDDAAGGKLNSKVHQITALEDTTKASFWKGSGRERTKQEQIDGLAFNAVREIEEWLVEQHEQRGWFDDRDARAAAAGTATPG